MKKLMIFLVLIVSFVGIILAIPITPPTRLCWNPNTETDLAGYKVYWTKTSGSYTDVMSRDVLKPAVSAIVSSQVCVLIADNVFNPTPAYAPKGTIYFVVTAYDASKNESIYSSEVSGTWPWTSWKGSLTIN